MQLARNAALFGSVIAPVVVGAFAWLTLASSRVEAQVEQTTPPAGTTVQPEAPAEPVPPMAATPAEPASSAPTGAISAAPAAPVQPETKCPVCEAHEDPKGRGAFLLGFGWFDLSALNDRLAAEGYERISQPLTLIGGQGHAIFDSGFVAGGMGAAIIGPSGSGPGALQTDFGGGFGMADVGFAFVHTPAVLFTVIGGFGGYGWSLSIDDPTSTSFDAVLRNPRRGASLSQGGILFGAAVTFEAHVAVGKPERGRQGFCAVGVRAGGLYGPPLGEWSLNDGSELTSGPDAAMAGFYAALTLGFGGRRATP